MTPQKSRVGKRGGGIKIVVVDLLVAQWFFSFGDIWAIVRFRFFGVQLNKVLHSFRNVVFVKNGFDGALGYASFAIDTFFRVDVKHGFAFVETFYWADDDAIGISAAITGFGYYVSHMVSPNRFKHGLV
jgi:hypothetical protein